MPTQKEITDLAFSFNERTIIDAIRADGYNHGKYTYINYRDDEIVAACAYGQAALNLAPEEWSLGDKAQFAGSLHSHALGLNRAFLNVVHWNDESNMSLEDIADSLESMIFGEPNAS